MSPCFSGKAWGFLFCLIENLFTRQLQANAKKIVASIKGKTRAAFDKAYAKNEAAYHKAVISTVENIVLPVLKTHLQHAEMVEKNLSKMSSRHIYLAGSICLLTFLIACNNQPEQTTTQVPNDTINSKQKDTIASTVLLKVSIHIQLK